MQDSPPNHVRLKSCSSVIVSQLYQPASGSGHSESMFQCLDENKTLIPFRAVNDDFCDCPDGSDEPGTSACSYIKGRKFWCKNEGHISAWIWSSRVGDGICGKLKLALSPFLVMLMTCSSGPLNPYNSPQTRNVAMARTRILPHLASGAPTPVRRRAENTGKPVMQRTRSERRCAIVFHAFEP